MKTIQLTQGYYSFVDDEDFERLNQWKWQSVKGTKTVYVRRRITEFSRFIEIRMHRYILGLKNSDLREIDHINGDGLDNRKCNLRICTHAENQRNRQIQIHTSKYKGVHWCKSSGKWVAQICFNYKIVYLGCFDNEIDAAKIYDRRAKELFGEFAKLNFK